MGAIDSNNSTTIGLELYIFVFSASSLNDLRDSVDLAISSYGSEIELINIAKFLSGRVSAHERYKASFVACSRKEFNKKCRSLAIKLLDVKSILPRIPSVSLCDEVFVSVGRVHPKLKIFLPGKLGKILNKSPSFSRSSTKNVSSIGEYDDLILDLYADSEFRLLKGNSRKNKKVYRSDLSKYMPCLVSSLFKSYIEIFSGNFKVANDGDMYVGMRVNLSKNNDDKLLLFDSLANNTFSFPFKTVDNCEYCLNALIAKLFVYGEDIRWKNVVDQSFRKKLKRLAGLCEIILYDVRKENVLDANSYA